MPSLKSSLVTLDPNRYTPVAQMPRAASPMLPIAHLPEHLTASPVMITGLPAISTNVDGVTRQFYRTGRVPARRIALPL